MIPFLAADYQGIAFLITAVCGGVVLITQQVFSSRKLDVNAKNVETIHKNTNSNLDRIQAKLSVTQWIVGGFAVTLMCSIGIIFRLLNDERKRDRR